MADKHQIIVINPGSTSTKFAVYEDEQSLFAVNLRRDLLDPDEQDIVPTPGEFQKSAALR